MILRESQLQFANSFLCHTSAKSAAKSFACHTSKIAVCNPFVCHTSETPRGAFRANPHGSSAFIAAIGGL